MKGKLKRIEYYKCLKYVIFLYVITSLVREMSNCNTLALQITNTVQMNYNVSPFLSNMMVKEPIKDHMK